MIWIIPEVRILGADQKERGLWGRDCTRGGVLLGILGGSVSTGSLNPEPISDQNMLFSIRLFALVVPLKTIPGEWSKSITVFRPTRLKKHTLWGAHTTIANIGGYSPGKCVDLS